MLSAEQRDLLIESLKHHEGWRASAYQDSHGIWSIGYGTNLQELSIDRATGERWLHEAIQRCEHEAQRFPWFARLNEARQRVVLEMIYNLGLTRFVGFIRMLGALDRGNFDLAATEMMASKWASQVGVRATKLAAIMRGPYPEDGPP